MYMPRSFVQAGGVVPSIDVYGLVYDGSSAGHGLKATVAGLTTSTMMAWIYSGPSPVINHSLFATATGKEQWWITSGNNLVIRANNTEKIITISDNTWYHVCTQWLGSTTPIYINGSLADTVAAGANELPGSTTHNVGQDDGDDNTFKGTIVDFIRMTGAKTPTDGNFDTGGGGQWKDVSGYTPGSGDYRLAADGGVVTNDYWSLASFAQVTGTSVVASQANMPPGL